MELSFLLLKGTKNPGNYLCPAMKMAFHDVRLSITKTNCTAQF